jgi:hypothetical protein
MTQRITGLEVFLLPAVALLAMACGGSPKPNTGPRPEENWVATTCSPATPDTTGWKVYRFADLDLSVPPEFTARNRTERAIEFVFRNSSLVFFVSPSPTRELFYAAGRPALAKEEAGCESSLSGYPGVVFARARANTFSVSAEWDGAPLWGASDWRKRLIARITTARLTDATRLRDALHMIRVVPKP